MRALPGTRFRLVVPAIASMLALSLGACTVELAREVARETGKYADGSPAWERTFLLAPGGRKIPHGAQATWHPGGGPRRTLEFYDRGLRQGYAFEWDDRGELIRLAQCEDGFCAERALPGTSSEAAKVLASARFEPHGLRIASAR